jgi:HrpA-like RNA helicase
MAVQIAIRIHLNEPAGDILAFLTGFEECETATRKCFGKL